jgi:hypothetical protein
MMRERVSGRCAAESDYPRCYTRVASGIVLRDEEMPVGEFFAR